MDALNDRAIQGLGTPDSAWMPWLVQAGIKQATLRELCPGGSRLVVVAPHPDDEVLACGGLLAMRAALGLPSLVVAVTNGEASHGILQPWENARLGARRSEESHAGLRTLGLQTSGTVRIGIPDGEASRFEGAIAERLQRLLKPSDVVVTTWQMDGHPDHEATGLATAKAAADAGCRLLQAPVWMWHWAEPGNTRVPWHAMVRLPLPDEAWVVKQQALQCHLSQLEPRSDGQGPVLMPAIVSRAARTSEYFFACLPA